MHAFIEKKEAINTQLAEGMTDFKDTLAKLTSSLNFQEKGKFPSQPQQNPKGQYNANASSSGSQHMDQVKLVITLCSGKVIEKSTLKPCEKDDESIYEGKEGVESEHCKEKIDSPLALPFPHAMSKQRKVNHNSEILQYGFYWPTMFKDTHVFCKAYENCQNSGFISKHKESLDNLLLTFETYPDGDVHCAFHKLCPHFHK